MRNTPSSGGELTIKGCRDRGRHALRGARLVGVKDPQLGHRGAGDADALVETFDDVVHVVDHGQGQAAAEVAAEVALGLVDRVQHRLDERVGSVGEQLLRVRGVAALLEHERLLDLRRIDLALVLELEADAPAHEHALAAVGVDRHDDVVVQQLLHAAGREGDVTGTGHGMQFRAAPSRPSCRGSSRGSARGGEVGQLAVVVVRGLPRFVAWAGL